MPRYEWQGADTFRDRRNDREIEPGDVVELDAHVAEPQSEFVRVETDSDEAGAADESDDEDGEGEPDDEEADTDDAPIDPTEYTVDELRDVLAEGGFDADTLDTIADAERAGEGRQTALDAIDAARE